MIYDCFMDIEKHFDTLLVDAYGVFWNGNALIPGAADTLADQVTKGKRVCIVSNTSAVDYSYESKGLFRGKHYTDVVTSGDVFYDFLKRDSLPFPGHRLYVIGRSKIDITAGTLFRLTDEMTDADMIYFGVPQVRQVPSLSIDETEYFLDKDVYNLSAVTPFIPEMKQAIKRHLPAVSTNPDQIVSEAGHWVVRQGSMAKAYRELSGTVLEFGKPYQNIYDYTFQKLGIKPSPKVAMIGDTFRTDMQGALNSGITPVWCVDTGVARYEVLHGKSLEQQAGSRFSELTLIHHL